MSGGTTLPMDPAAVEALITDPVLGSVLQRVGSFTPHYEPDLWWSLVDSIASQQLSVKAAATIVGRIEALGREGRPSPRDILSRSQDELRGCGLSGAKARYLLDLARHFHERLLIPEEIARLPDEEVITELTRVKGVGRWTAHMILIFTLRRPDVLPTGDLGLQNAVQRLLGSPERPSPSAIEALAEPWRPYRTTASLYLWRSLSTP